MQRPTPAIEKRIAQIRLVLMDIDGTLVSSDKATFDNVAVQLRRLKPLNIRFSLATGRTITGALPILGRLRDVGMRMPPLITYNGAILLSGQDLSLLERHLLRADDYVLAIERCRSWDLWPIVYACRDTVAGPPLETVYVDQSGAPTREFNGMMLERVDNLLNIRDDIVAVLVDAGNPDASMRLAAELAAELGDRVRVSTSGSRYVEICDPQGTKLAAMNRLATLYHLSTDQIMAIGDNLNDLEMISGAGVGVAVGNAPDQVKAAATYTCHRRSAEGVVEALRMLVQVVRHARHSSAGDARCRPTSQSITEESPTSWLSAS